MELVSACRQALATAQNYNESWHLRAITEKVVEQPGAEGMVPESFQ